MPRLSISLFLALFVHLGACRKEAPDEVVYTGRKFDATATAGATTTGGVVSTVSVGVGGTSSSGAGGAGGDPGAGRAGSTNVGGGGAAGAGGAPAFTKSALLAASADCAIARYRDAERLARDLRDKARSYSLDRSEANATAARTAWVATMASWEQAELFRFGPMGRAPEPGARDLRDQIYGWPLVNRCKIDEQIVSRAYARTDFPASLINGRGLGAFEYLIFYAGGDNGCSQFSIINQQGAWNAMAGSELAQRKADYAAAVADDILAHASALLEAWDPAAGNFRKELVGAATSPLFGSEQKALNVVSDALFYIEQEVKDWKLGRPLGLVDCMTGTCPDAVESIYARVSAANIRANLVGFRRLFEGCADDGAGIGFDDWLRAVGGADLAERILVGLSGAEAALDEIDVPLEQAVITEIDEVRRVHTATKMLTDLLKTEFVTVLNLELPKGSEGDND